MQADEIQFDIRIREKGSRFDEKIRINEKENTVSFEVPKHNEANRSEVLNDFNLVNNIYWTIIADVWVLYNLIIGDSAGGFRFFADVTV